MIEALTAVAAARTPWDTFHALTQARELLGDEADDYWPLLESIARRQTEIEQLERLAGSDPMTGVGNRRTFGRALDREVARYGRSGDPFAVILLDLDDLKGRNDTLGHAAGDAAIMAVANVCQEAVRSTDVVARLGGDEFALLLAGSNLAGAWAFAERLRERVEEVTIDHMPLRVSLGVAAVADGMDGDAVLASADAALYRDKAARKAEDEDVAEVSCDAAMSA